MNSKIKFSQGRFFLRCALLLVFVSVFFNFNLSPDSNLNNSLQIKCVNVSFAGDDFMDSTTNSPGVTPTESAAFYDVGGKIMESINELLDSILGMMGWMLGAASYLFDTILEPETFRKIANGDGIRTGWEAVRDFLNIGFILILLFSAFSTIFQVEKFHLKKILLTLVIMALLVNFSFPISRFIIDTANVPMYFLLNQAFPDNKDASMAARMAEYSKVARVVAPGQINGSKDMTIKLLLAIFYTFLLAITMMVMSLLFLVRTVALAILIVFSPIGFVAGILPSTKNFADSWWSSLFKYAFFGPIMVFMVVLSMLMMKSAGADANPASLFNDMRSGAANYTGLPSDTNYLASATFFFIPLIILWFGMIVAQKAGAAGATAGLKFAKGGMMKVTGSNFMKRQYAGFSAARKKRQEEKGKTAIGGRIGKSLNKAQDRVVGAVPLVGRGAKKRVQQTRETENKEGIKKGADNLIDQGATADSLAADVDRDFNATPKKRKDRVKQAQQAAAYLKQNSDDRKAHIVNTISASGGVAGSDLENILTAPASPSLSASASIAYTKSKTAANDAAARINTATTGGIAPSENDIRAVSAFVNKQMNAKVNTGSKA